jgi:ACS family hexuronate transporter-like MFS transporter
MDLPSTNRLMRNLSQTSTAMPLSPSETYVLISSLAFGWVIVFGGMSSISPLLPFLRAEFQLSGSQTGLLTSFLMLPYLLMQIPGGLLADRFGAKRLLVVMLLFAGLSLTVLGLWPFGLTMFTFVMMLYRTGCSIYYPATFGTSSGIVPTEKRGLVGALLTMGTAIGGAVGIALAVPLCYLAGGNWRFSFVVFGLLTLTLPLLFQTLKWPEQRTSTASFSTLAVVFKDRTVVTLLAINFATNYGSGAILVWGPSFLGAERGLSAVEAGFYIALVNLIGFPAGLVSGVISDRFGRRYVTMFLFAAAGLSVAVLAWFTPPLFVLGAIVGYGLFGKWTADAPLAAWLGDHSMRNYPTMANAIFGVNNSARVIGMVLSPLITGVLLDWTGTLSSGMLLAGVVLGIAAFLVLFIPGAENGDTYHFHDDRSVCFKQSRKSYVSLFFEGFLAAFGDGREEYSHKQQHRHSEQS